MADLSPEQLDLLFATDTVAVNVLETWRDHGTEDARRYVKIDTAGRQYTVELRELRACVRGIIAPSDVFLASSTAPTLREAICRAVYEAGRGGEG